MSSSDAQPPLTRRQARERERAADGGAQPVTPPPTVAAPASAAEEPRRRPGSHVAPAAPAPAQTATPAPTQSAAPSVPDVPPASATEIVPGTGMTRRQLRALRAAEQQAVQPVPLQTPTPQSSDRTVADVLGTVRAIEDGADAQPGGSADARPAADAAQAVAPGTADESTPAARSAAPAASSFPTWTPPATVTPATTTPAAQEPVPSPAEAPEPAAHHLPTAAVEQATSADGSPDEIESLDDAAAHAEEPRRRRSTWAAHDEQPVESVAEAEPASPETAAPASPETAAPAASQAVAPAGAEQVATEPAAASDESAVDRGTSVPTAIVPSLPAAPSPRTPGVFPLDLEGDDADTNEVPVQPYSQSGSPEPAAQERPVEPKPITTAFSPGSHWSQEDDSEVHDTETGIRRVADTRTNAIILPNSALGDVTGALNATGEVILTGSIDLPKSLSSTGSHRPIDGAEVDRLLDQQDEQPETDASPVRASRAVSSHTSTRQVVLAAAKPQKQSRVPVVLAVSAASVGVAAVALIVAAVFVFNGN